MKEANLKGSSFSFDQRPISPGMVITIDGHKFSGKTRFGLTGPDPVALQSLDEGEDGIVQGLQADGHRIAVARYPYVWDPSLKSKGDFDKQGEHLRNTVWARFEADFYHALKGGFRTIVWDTGTEVWGLLRLAHFGKLSQVPEQAYGVVNAEFLSMLKAARQAQVVFIITHHLKEERERYVEMTPQGPREKSKTTGRYVRDGMSRIGGQVDVELLSRYIPPKKNKQGTVIEEGRFEIEVGAKSRLNKDAVGMVFTNADFPEVASLLHPAVDVSAWECPGVKGAGTSGGELDIDLEVA